MSYWLWLKGEINHAAFLLAGRRPWRRGYGEHRQAQLKRVLARGDFNPADLPPGYGFRLDERIVEYPWLFSRLPETAGTLLDAGSVLNHPFLLERPKLRSKRVFISTLAPESIAMNRLGVSYVYEDLRHSCFRDNYFDSVVSLSTIEHIGMDNTMLYTGDMTKRERSAHAHLDAIRELRRVLRPGGVLFLSMPFGAARDHGWFQVFDGAMVDRVVEACQPAQVQESHFRYTPAGWVPSSRGESRHATYFDIHKQRTYDPDFAAASRAVVCLEMIK